MNFYNQNQHSYDLGDIVEFPAGSGNYDVMVVENDHDYANTTPTINKYFQVKGWFQEYSSVPSQQPKLVLTFGYDKSVAGSDSPVKVIGVATSGIEKVIGV